MIVITIRLPKAQKKYLENKAAEVGMKFSKFVREELPKPPPNMEKIK